MIDHFDFNFIDTKRGFISVEGPDAIAFLNGLMTNDINKLNQNHDIIYTCLLSSQGKYESDFFIFKWGTIFIIDCLQAHVPILLQKFKLYKLRADVVISDQTSRWFVRLSLGQRQDAQSFCDPRHSSLGYRSYYQTDCNRNLEQESDTQEAYTKFRLTQGIPCYPASLIPNKTIPLEANMDELNAISWDKGCYLGQELTARTKYRGTINKRYVPIHLESGTPEIGWEIQYKGEKIGSLLEFNDTVGLARLSIDMVIQIIKRGEVMTQKYCTLRPTIPSWLKLY